MLDVLDESVLSHGMIPSVFVSPQVLKVTLHFWSVNGNDQFQSRAIDLKEKKDYCINTTKSCEGAGCHIVAKVGLQPEPTLW